MHFYRPAILLLISCLTSQAAAQGFLGPEGLLDELKLLEGKWVAVEGRQAGNDLSPEQLSAVYFTTGGLSIEPFGRAMIQLHPKQRQFSFLYGQVGLKAEGRGLGAYEVEGDRLRVAIIKIPPGGIIIQPLPNSFAEALERAHTVLKFTRKKG